MDPTTQNFIQAVITLLKERHAEITREVMPIEMKYYDPEPQESWWMPPPVEYQMVQQYSFTPVTTLRPNMMGLLPENNCANRPYCSECDFSDLVLPHDSVAYLPTSTQVTQTTTNYGSYVNSYETDVLSNYIVDAANDVSSQYVHPSEFDSANQTYFCGECID